MPLPITSTPQSFVNKNTFLFQSYTTLTEAVTKATLNQVAYCYVLTPEVDKTMHNREREEGLYVYFVVGTEH